MSLFQEGRMSNVTFTEADFASMDKKSKELLGWTFKEKFGMSIKEMVADPTKGQEAILSAKRKAGIVDRIKIGKIMDFLTEPDWEQTLKEKLA
jgi:hypothetical protein